MKYKRIGILLVGLSVLLGSCNGGDMGSMEKKIETSVSSITGDESQGLAAKKFFWGHQSVGSNIIGGLERLLTAHPKIPLKVVKVDPPYTLTAGALNHSNVGNNVDPSSKIKDFVKMMDSGMGNQADLAFFKFCWIDFNARSDADAVFAEYKAAMQLLKEKYPQTRFMHATVPLLKVQTGPKAWVKKIIGRSLDGTKDNIPRCRFNDLLRAEYGGKDPIFDIARYESTRPDGSRETFTLDGREYFALVPAYTNDGGHLNKIGSEYLASELLKVLVQAVATEK